MESFYGSSPRIRDLLRLAPARYRYVNGKRNTHRNPGFWTVDARLAREFSFSGNRHVRAHVRVFNLLNDDTLRVLEVNEGT